MASPIAKNKLTQYLLGELPEEECEQFDELSIADDEFAQCLCAAENDLLDAYLFHELPDDTLHRFESYYLSTPMRRQRVEMERLLYLAGSRRRVAPRDTISINSFFPLKGIAGAVVGVRSAQEPAAQTRWWSIAAILLLALSTGWLSFSNYRLRNQNRAIEDAYRVQEKRARQLLSQVETPNSAKTSTDHTLQSAQAASREDGIFRKKQASIADHTTASLGSILLLPQTRGISPIAFVSLSQETQSLQFRLQLESDDFPQYRVAIRDLTSNKLVWQSKTQKSVLYGRDQVISFQLPTISLEQHDYAAELTGLTSGGTKDLISSYVFKITRKPSQ